jgi:hypothetical protein
MFRRPDPSVDLRRLPWCCSKPDFLVAALAFPSPMLHMYVSSVLDVSNVCCSCFIFDVAKVAYVASVLEVCCCKCLFKMFYLFPDVYCNRFFIWMLHMFHTYLQHYVPNISAVLVLCCSKWFHVTSCNFWMFHVFHTHVASACSKCFVYFLTYIAFKYCSCCKLFMFFGRRQAGWVCSAPEG